MNPFVGEVQAVGFNFAPTGWALCAGQLLVISQNTALFSLLGTFYGGDGKSTFALPNLLNNAAMGQGQSPGTSDWSLGSTSGSQHITVLTSEMPLHNHLVEASGFGADQINPAPDEALDATALNSIYSKVVTNTTPMSPNATTVSGGSLPHNNMMPFLALTWIIALQGVFPPRG